MNKKEFEDEMYNHISISELKKFWDAIYPKISLNSEEQCVIVYGTAGEIINEKTGEVINSGKITLNHFWQPTYDAEYYNAQEESDDYYLAQQGQIEYEEQRLKYEEQEQYQQQQEEHEYNIFLKECSDNEFENNVCEIDHSVEFEEHSFKENNIVKPASVKISTDWITSPDIPESFVIEPSRVKPEFESLPKINKIISKNAVMQFGKYNGMTFGEIMYTQASYILWLEKEHPKGIFISKELLDEAYIESAKQQKVWKDSHKNPNTYGKIDNDINDDLPF